MHFHTPDTTTLTPESPPACPGSASFLVVSGLPAQGDFLFSDDHIVNWFDTQTEDTCRFWIYRAVELFSLPDYSATPRQCWAAFYKFATCGVLTVSPDFELAPVPFAAFSGVGVSEQLEDYLMDRVCFLSSVHLFRATLTAKGPQHLATLHFSRLACSDAGRLLAAVPEAV